MHIKQRCRINCIFAHSTNLPRWFSHIFAQTYEPRRHKRTCRSHIVEYFRCVSTFTNIPTCVWERWKCKLANRLHCIKPHANNIELKRLKRGNGFRIPRKIINFFRYSKNWHGFKSERTIVICYQKDEIDRISLTSSWSHRNQTNFFKTFRKHNLMRNWRRKYGFWSINFLIHFMILLRSYFLIWNRKHWCQRKIWPLKFQRRLKKIRKLFSRMMKHDEKHAWSWDTIAIGCAYLRWSSHDCKKSIRFFLTTHMPDAKCVHLPNTGSLD